MRSVLYPLILVTSWVAGCYSPKLGNPGYFCHADDKPACPDGQECVQGRCQNRGIHLFGSDGGGGQPVDLAGQLPPPDDLSQTTGGKTGCNGYVKCLIACGASTTCPPGCDANVTADGKMKFQTAIACGQNWCINSASPPACMVNAAGTMLVDASGAPPGACTNCLNNSLAKLFGTPCSPTNDPNCNPSTCSASNNACSASTP